MSNSDSQNVYGLYPELYQVAAGVTVTISVIAGQNAAMLKYISGGSLSVVGTTTGLGGSFVVDNRYPMATGEIINLDLSGNAYVVALGATCVFALLRGRTSGF